MSTCIFCRSAKKVSATLRVAVMLCLTFAAGAAASSPENPNRQRQKHHPRRYAPTHPRQRGIKPASISFLTFALTGMGTSSTQSAFYDNGVDVDGIAIVAVGVDGRARPDMGRRLTVRRLGWCFNVESASRSGCVH